MRALPSDRISKASTSRRRKTRRKRTARWRRYARWAGNAFLLLIGITVALIVPFRWVDPTTSAFMLQDESGRTPLMFEWIGWPEMGSALPLAVVAAEDQKFASHYGFDVSSIRASVEDFSAGEPLRGASTITQQVAKNLYLWPGRAFLRKGIEAWLTLWIELTWPKERILETYLNIAEFGPGVYGARAASRFHFGKSPAALSDAEAALLAAVLPNPKALSAHEPSAYVLERQRWILSQMQRLRREQWLLRLL